MEQKESEKIKNQKRGCMGCLTVLMALIVVVIVASIIGSDDEVVISNRDELTLDEFIIKTAQIELGEPNNNKNRVRTLDEAGYIKNLYLVADDNFTSNMIIDGCIFDTIKLMKKYTEDEEFMSANFAGIKILWGIEVVDGYGNVSEDIGVGIMFMKEELSKYDWDNVSTDGIKNTAHTFWINPVLEK